MDYVTTYLPVQNKLWEQVTTIWILIQISLAVTTRTTKSSTIHGKKETEHPGQRNIQPQFLICSCWATAI